MGAIHKPCGQHFGQFWPTSSLANPPRKPCGVLENPPFYCKNSRSSTAFKVVFGRVFPQKNVAECLSDILFFKTQFFFVKWRNVQLCMLIKFITIFFIYRQWFYRNNSISGATTLTALRKESLVLQYMKSFIRVDRPLTPPPPPLRCPHGVWMPPYKIQ